MAEQRDVNARAVWWSAAGLAATIALVLIVLAPFQRASRIGAPTLSAPPPALQQNPADDLRVMRAAEDATLRSYGWIDRDAGTIRIPIERAIELTAQRGLPAR